MDVVTPLLALELVGLAVAAWLRVRRLRRRGMYRPPAPTWEVNMRVQETTGEPEPETGPEPGEPQPSEPDDGEEGQAS